MNELEKRGGEGVARTYWLVICPPAKNSRIEDQQGFLLKAAKVCHAIDDDGLVLVKLDDRDAWGVRFWTEVEARMFLARADYWLYRYGRPT